MTDSPVNHQTRRISGDQDPSNSGILRMPVIDREAALARMGNDKSLLEQLAQFFLEDAPQLLGELEAAMSARDAKSVHHAAHSLKGLAANFEAQRAIARARKIELLSRDANLADCEPLVEPLRQEIHRVMDALKELLQQIG